MNYEAKIHSKGFYYQILGAVTVLKFLQALALGPIQTSNFTCAELNSYFSRLKL